MSSSQSRLLTPNDIAEQLSVSLTSVYGLLRSGKLRCKRIGPKGWLYRVTPEQLDEYLESADFEVQSAPPPRPRLPRMSPEARAAIERFKLG